MFGGIQKNDGHATKKLARGNRCDAISRVITPCGAQLVSAAHVVATGVRKWKTCSIDVAVGTRWLKYPFTGSIRYLFNTVALRVPCGRRIDFRCYLSCPDACPLNHLPWLRQSSWAESIAFCKCKRQVLQQNMAPIVGSTCSSQEIRRATEKGHILSCNTLVPFASLRCASSFRHHS
jgi:hypothetical protein